MNKRRQRHLRKIAALSPMLVTVCFSESDDWFAEDISAGGFLCVAACVHRFLDFDAGGTFAESEISYSTDL
jgi:hypothetical protein